MCDQVGPSPCPRCLPRLRRSPPEPVPPIGLDAWASLLAYEGAARRLVTGFKYRDDRATLAWLADGMAALVDPPAGAVVTWAPTSARRRRRRGFDQAELLARAVARRWGVPCRRLLVRRGPSRPQTGASRSERETGPRLVAVTGPRRDLPGAVLRPFISADVARRGRPGPRSPAGRPQGMPAAAVVVDDVVTTGATLRAAAEALRAAGVVSVCALTAARTARLDAPSRHSVPAFPPGVNKSLKLAPEPTEYGS